MTDIRPSDRDVNRVIRSWLHEDRHEDVSRVAGAVLDQVEATPQRRATWWPARRTPNMNKFVPSASARLPWSWPSSSGPSSSAPASDGVGGAPSTTPSPSPIGGKVEYQIDGAAATTEVTAVADGASVSGTAVTKFGGGTHTVRLACAAGTAIPGPSPARPSRPRSQASVPATGRRSSSRTARPSTSGSGSPTTSRRVATVTTCWKLPLPDPSAFSPVESGALVPPPISRPEWDLPVDPHRALWAALRGCSRRVAPDRG